MKYIELFAGCGGLSVGLESLGYEMVLANELSPMASETFAYNLLNENLRQLAEKKESEELQIDQQQQLVSVKIVFSNKIS